MEKTDILKCKDVYEYLQFIYAYTNQEGLKDGSPEFRETVHELHALLWG